MATQFDRLNRDILNTLKPYLGKEIDRAIIEGMTLSRKYSYLTWFSRAISIGVSLGVIAVTMESVREKELVGAFLALMIGAPFALGISLIADYADIVREESDIANQGRRLRLTLDLLERAKASL